MLLRMPPRFMHYVTRFEQRIRERERGELLSCVGLGLGPVLVHDGGPEINHWLKLLNIQRVFQGGLRVTDATIKIISMVLVGNVNKDLVSLIKKVGVTATGFSGMDGRLLTVRPTPNSAQLVFVGDQPHSSGSLTTVTSGDCFGGGGLDGQSYNINGDAVAREIAGALGAEKLILLMDKEPGEGNRHKGDKENDREGEGWKWDDP